MTQNLMNISGTLEKAENAVQSFIANYSKAMKTPLRKIAKAVQEEKNKVDKYNLKVIEENLLKIELTLNELENQIKIARPQPGLVFFNLRQLVDEIVNELPEVNGPFKNTLSINIAEPTMLFSDRTTLGELLKELISNALHIQRTEGYEAIVLESEIHSGQCIINFFKPKKSLMTGVDRAAQRTKTLIPLSNTLQLTKTTGERFHLEVAPSEDIMYTVAIPGNL